MSAATEPTTIHRNEIYLVGEISTVPAERTFADGRDAVTFRLDVRLETEQGAAKDSFEITVTNARTRKAAVSWDVGAIVEVEGHVRRKFHKAGSGWKPFTVVEATRAKRLRV